MGWTMTYHAPKLPRPKEYIPFLVLLLSLIVMLVLGLIKNV